MVVQPTKKLNFTLNGIRQTNMPLAIYKKTWIYIVKAEHTFMNMYEDKFENNLI